MGVKFFFSLRKKKNFKKIDLECITKKKANKNMFEKKKKAEF